MSDMIPSPLLGKKSSWDYGADTMRFIPTPSPFVTYYWVLVLELGMLSLDCGALILICFLLSTVVWCFCCCGSAVAIFATAWPDPLTLKLLLNVGFVLACKGIPGKVRCRMSYCLKLFYFALAAFFFFFFFLDAFIFAHRGSTTRRMYF